MSVLAAQMNVQLAAIFHPANAGRRSRTCSPRCRQ
jgi:hypothetical protein